MNRNTVLFAFSLLLPQECLHNYIYTDYPKGVMLQRKDFPHCRNKAVPNTDRLLIL